MKKKEIEKIPYLTLSKVCRKKDVRYIGVTACKDIGGVRHLFLDTMILEKTGVGKKCLEL